MIKFKQGSVTNPKNGVTKDIVVKAKSPNSLKDILLGGSMVLMGIIYLTATAFKKGSMSYEDAEMTAFSDADLFLDSND